MKKTLLVNSIAIAAMVGSISVSAELPCDKDPGTSAQVTDTQAQDLTQTELQEIRDRVLKRCGLSSKMASNRLPWYFHYEFGRELVKQGAAGDAIEPLQLTANMKPESVREARMYGAWFIDYVPYYQMSVAYAELGQWDSAWDAIRMSENLVEFSPGDFDYDKFVSLKDRITQNRAANS